MKRADDYAQRRQHLAKLSDEELKDYFWQLTEQLVAPLIKAGYENTSPSIERSVLLRMGFSSLEAKQIVAYAQENELLGYGAGNVVYRVAKEQNMPLKEAGIALSTGKLWEQAANIFKGVE